MQLVLSAILTSTVCVCVFCVCVKCDPLCEMQAKVSKSDYEITSIKVGFQPLISL